MKASAKVQRRLFDNSIHVNGREVSGLKISLIEDIFQNTEEEIALKYDNIEAIVNYPTDFPIDRYRLEGQLSVGETRTFFFDVLPIEIYTKIDNSVEKDDYIFHFFEDEHGNRVPMLLQITETFGRFTTSLIWRKHYCAPKNGPIPPNIKALLEEKYGI
jgi:hypothetical protein